MSVTKIISEKGGRGESETGLENVLLRQEITYLKIPDKRE
jgi:hypothetical protein